MYTIFNKFLHDIYKIKNETIFINDLIEYELSILDKAQYEYLKRLLKSNNIRIITIKEKITNKDVSKNIRRH